MEKSEKSKRISYQGDVNPSAPPPPVYANQSSIHQKKIIQETSYPGHDHGNQHHQSLNYDFQSVVVRRAPEPPEPMNNFQTVSAPHPEPNERYCRKLHRNRRQTGSICGGK